MNKKMKVIVVGCTHSGTAAVKTIRKTYPYDNMDFLGFGWLLLMVC
ncbi:MAG: hypothetical protein Q8883_02580 [Sweet potato little leaf phytoplasma]|nr:hypothetical protein [Sweet potato little leaf phytoplasma]